MIEELLKIWPLLAAIAAVAVSVATARGMGSQARRSARAAHGRLDEIVEQTYSRDLANARELATLGTRLDVLSDEHKEFAQKVERRLDGLDAKLDKRFEDVGAKLDRLFKDGCARKC